MTTIADVLEATPVTDLDLARHVTVDVATTISDTIAAMNQAEVTCALVLDDDALAGIFTQRDVLIQVLGHGVACSEPVTAAMTATVQTMASNQSLADGLHIMNDLWVRNVPVLSPDRELVGNLSYYPLMKRIAQLLSERALRTPHEVSVQHGMEFIDFTGLNYSQPVTVHATNTAADASYQMQSRSIGSVFVVDDREHVVGVLTEYDLQTKLACSTADPEQMLVRDIMTADPVALSVRSSIGSAIQQMAEHGFSHVPLLGESGRLVGVTSFRDVADYFETSLTVLS